MGPHNVSRPPTATVNFTDDTLVQPPPSPTVQARTAFNRTFGPMPTVQNPFTGMSQGPATPARAPQTGFDGLGSPGTGRIGHRGEGAVREQIHTFSMMSPAERSTFFNRSRRTDLAHLSHGGVRRSPNSVGQLHARATHTPALHAAPTHVPIHGRPTATTGRAPETRPQPSVHVQYSGSSVAYNPQAGGRRHTVLEENYRARVTAPEARSPRPMQHAPTSTRAERHAEVQAQIAEVRANLALARSNVLTAENRLFRQNDRQHSLERAESTFTRAQQGLRALQANHNLTRAERLEVSQLARDTDFRSMTRDINNARLNLELDNI